RDKIAASKARGMWMGGIPPLGYRAEGRSLAIVEEHAQLVRDIHARFLALGNVRLVAQALEGDGILTPRRTTASGHAFGGKRFSRGQVRAILTNPVYAGQIAHKGKVHPGKHEAIIAREDWDAVQRRLASHARRPSPRTVLASLLAGRIVDDRGRPLVAAHTCRGKGKARRRYRYYVSRDLQHGTRADATDGLRIPASEIEPLVAGLIARRLDDPLGLAEWAGLLIAPSRLNAFLARCRTLAAELRSPAPSAMSGLLSRVQVGETSLEVVLSAEALAAAFDLPLAPHAPATLLFSHDVRLTRTGRAVRLVHPSGAPATGGTPDPVLVRLLLRARHWWGILAQGELDPAALARREGVTSSYITRVVRLAFLAPAVLEAILEGRLRAGIDSAALLRAGTIDPDWNRQQQLLVAR
ncbi:MAG: recombinase family protein, partial [Novosphingobium sp.]|nr:recombinase family protein [Novosphingobium sp.]